MPIRPQFRYLYPIDWPQLSALIRFKRAGGRCEQCGRPHGQTVKHLGNGIWWDEARSYWVNGRGRPLPRFVMHEGLVVRSTKVVLATAHRDHDPTHTPAPQKNTTSPDSRASTSCGGKAGPLSEKRSDIDRDPH